MKTNVYIDGFNLYFRAVKNTSHKWLNLLELSQALVPAHQINKIRYFTAYVFNRSDANQLRRQLTYLRALRTLPNLSIHRGQFRERTKIRPLVTPIIGLNRNVEIFDTEEKRSDVNLATWLLVDAHNSDFEQALLISNDADLVLPVRLVREMFKRPVGVVNPNTNPRETMPAELSNAATFIRQLRIKTLGLCQFPVQLRDSRGTITKPATW